MIPLKSGSIWLRLGSGWCEPVPCNDSLLEEVALTKLRPRPFEPGLAFFSALDTTRKLIHRKKVANLTARRPEAFSFQGVRWRKAVADRLVKGAVRIRFRRFSHALLPTHHGVDLGEYLGSRRWEQLLKIRPWVTLKHCPPSKSGGAHRARCRQRAFSRSTRLRDFLLYVGKQSLKEGCPKFTNRRSAPEFSAGPPPTIAVRIILSGSTPRTRKRIESYFESTGVNEPLLFEIPAAATGSSFAADWPSSRRRVQVQAESAREITPVGDTTSRQDSRKLRHLRRLVWPLVSISLALAASRSTSRTAPCSRHFIHGMVNRP